MVDEEKKKVRQQKKYEYHNSHFKMKPIPFSDLNAGDVELLAWLDDRPKGTIAAYVKGLIREDMEREKKRMEQERSGE